MHNVFLYNWMMYRYLAVRDTSCLVGPLINSIFMKREGSG